MNHLDGKLTQRCRPNGRLERVVIIEDHGLYREALRKLCHDAGLKVLQSSGSASSAITIIRDVSPDLVLLDLQLDDGDGINVLQAFRECERKPRFVVVSSHCDDSSVVALERLEVAGYIAKSAEVDEMRRAMTDVAMGRCYFSRVYLEARRRRLFDKSSFDKILSARELEVLALVGEAMNNAEIAERLNISVFTAATHRKRLLAKLDLPSTAKLVRYAHRHGICRDW